MAANSKVWSLYLLKALLILDLLLLAAAGAEAFLAPGVGVLSLEVEWPTVDELLPSTSVTDDAKSSIRPEVDLPRLRDLGVSSGVCSISLKANKLDLTVTLKWQTPLRISRARPYLVPCSKLCPLTSRI